MTTSPTAPPDLVQVARNRYRELVAALAGGGECDLNDLLTICAAAGKSTEDLTRDVDRADLDRLADDGNPHSPETT